MSYASVVFYKNHYQGNSIPDDKIQAMLDSASEDIDTITRMKIHRLGGFDRLSDFEKNRVQLAVCSQADHLYFKSSLSGVSSYSVGDISVSLSDAVKPYDESCLRYLNSTRLVYRGL